MQLGQYVFIWKCWKKKGKPDSQNLSNIILCGYNQIWRLFLANRKDQINQEL